MGVHPHQRQTCCPMGLPGWVLAEAPSITVPLTGPHQLGKEPGPSASLFPHLPYEDHAILASLGLS